MDIPAMVCTSTPSTWPTPCAGYTTKSPATKSSFSIFFSTTGAGATIFGAAISVFLTFKGAAFFWRLCVGVTRTVVLLPFTVTLRAVTGFFAAAALTTVAFFAFGAAFVFVVFVIRTSFSMQKILQFHRDTNPQ